MNQGKILLALMLVFVTQLACTASFSVPRSATPTQVQDPTPNVPTQEPATQTLDVVPVTDLELTSYTNVEGGYRLQYPAAYTFREPRFIVIDPINAPGDTLGSAWVDIIVEPALGRTATQVADERIAPFGSGLNVSRYEITVANEPATIVDGLPGPDSIRNVFIVHNDKLFTLVFMPWHPTPDQSSPLEGLYDVVMNSFEFIE